MSTPPPPPPQPAMHELLERLTQAQETTQRQLADLQRAVTDAQAEATKTVVQKLDEERGYQFKKKGNEKQFRFNQTVSSHIDTAREALAKVGTMPASTAKHLEVVREELDKGAKQIATRQKKIRMADRSEFSWATVEAYESDDLADDSADEKRMEKAEKEAARRLAKKRSRRGRGSFSQDTYSSDAKRRGPTDSPSNPGPSGGVPAGPPRQRTLGPCWSCGNFGHLAVNCPKKTNQYPLSCAGVPSKSINVVCMSGVNIDPVLGSDCGNNELVIKPERATSNSEDGACSMNTAAHKIGDIELNVSHSGEKPIAKDGVNNSGVFDIQTGVNSTDKQTLGLQWINPFDDPEQEGADDAGGGDPTVFEWHTLVNRDPLGSENSDIDGNLRLWEVEQPEGQQITWVKGRLKGNIAFWQDVLKAPTPVLDWITKGYVLPLITDPPAYKQANQKSALEHKEFVDEAITDLLNNGCIQRVPTAPHVCSPLSVVCNSEGKNA